MKRYLSFRMSEASEHDVPCAIELLGKIGVKLPPGTDESNFLDRLCTAAHALANADSPQPQPEVIEEPPQPVTMSLTGRRVQRPPLRPNLPPGVKLAPRVSAASADEVLRQWDQATGKRGA